MALRPEHPGITGIKNVLDLRSSRNCAVVLLSCFEQKDTHACDAGLDHVKDFGRGAGKIDDAITGEGSAIVDAHIHSPVIRQVLDADACTEWQAAVRRRESAGIEDLAVGGGPALKPGPVPGGDTLLIRCWCGR